MKYRVSKQRDLIMNYLSCQKGHVNAEKIYQDLNENHSISLATVYRNLGILEKMGRIKKIALPEGTVYDKTIDPHCHFYCTSCGTLYDIEHVCFDHMTVGDDIVGKIDNHDITVKGICKHCM